MMMKPHIVWTGLLLVLFCQMMLAQPVDTTLQLSELIEEALGNNPQLLSSQKAWLSETARVPQAGALPDPVISFNLINLPVNSFDFDREPMTGKQIAIMQMFPFPGKQGLREDIARENATVAELRYLELSSQLIQKVKVAYYSLFFSDKAIEITLKNSEVLQEFAQIAETKYSVGTGLQQDVLRAQVELSKMTDRLINLQQTRDASEAKLNTLLNRPANSPIATLEKLTYKDLPLDFESLTLLADEHRPLLKAWDAMVRQSTQKINLARKEYWPDFSLGLAYSQRELLKNGTGGADFISGMFSAKIPLYFWRKQRKQVEESKYKQISVQDQSREVRNQVFSSLEITLSDVKKNSRLIDLFETGIIPQAAQSLQAAIAGYQTDKVDFLTLLNNQINLFNFEQDYYRVLSDYFKGIAMLEAQTGTQILEQ